MGDDIKMPMHYMGNGKIQAKDALGSMFIGYDVAGVPAMQCAWAFATFKYLWRWPLKNKLKDLYKARECLDNLIREVENEAIEKVSNGEDVTQ